MYMLKLETKFHFKYIVKLPENQDFLQSRYKIKGVIPKVQAEVYKLNDSACFGTKTKSLGLS